MPKMFDPKKESGKLDPFLKILPLVRNFGTAGLRTGVCERGDQCREGSAAQEDISVYRCWQLGQGQSVFYQVV